MAQPIVINGFSRGIAPSAHQGFGLMRNVEIESFPGAAKSRAKPQSLFHTSVSSTFTAVAATDVCTGATFTGNANATGNAVRLTTTGTLPAGLATSTVYFVIMVVQGDGTFKLATTITNADAGTAIDITGTGTGTHTVHSVNPGSINHIIKDEQSGFRFMQDSNGRVWWSEGSTNQSFLLHNSGLSDPGTGALTNASGNGIIFYRQNDAASTLYLIAFRNALVDIIDVYTPADKRTPSWTNGWNFGGATSDTTLNTGAGTNNTHYAIEGQDGVIYFCDGRYVGTIREKTGQTFNPADTATYVGNDQALDLPAYDIARHLEELGDTLLIAGKNSDKIYPWDRISDSFTQPIIVPERGIEKIKNVGGIVYILAGTKGNIYYTQGSYARLFLSLPDQIINNSGAVKANVVTWGGIASTMNSLLVGAGVETSGNSGIFRINLETKALIIDTVPSSGAANALSIEASSPFYYFGYSGGADNISTSRYDTLESVIESELFRMATKTEKGAYSVLEVVTAKPAAIGADIRIGYRYDTSSSFTTLDTFASDGVATTFKKDNIGLIDVEQIQIECAYDNVTEISEIRLLP